MAVKTKTKKEVSLQPIEIPKDFKELITLQPLITQAEVFELLKNNLDSYYENYFNSHQLTPTEVLDTIPVEQWEEYKKNTFKKTEYPEVKISTFDKILMDEYTIIMDYSDTINGKEYKRGDSYKKERRDIVIDYVKRKLVFIKHDLSYGHQSYGRETFFHFDNKKKTLKVEYKWAYVPWYNNRSAERYFSHFYTFDLKNDRILTVKNNNNEEESRY